MSYKLKSQPNGRYYYKLLDFLGSISKEFILVKNEQLEFNENAKLLLNSLSSNLLKKSFSNEWPGTRLLGRDKAEILHFKANQNSVDILKKYSNSLFDWLSPKLPEDLAFFREDGSLILGSITHEKDYWLDLRDEELKITAEKFPDLNKELIFD